MGPLSSRNSLIPNAIAPKLGNVETTQGYTLQPGLRALDFYESLEGMRVSNASSVSTSPTLTGDCNGDTCVVSRGQLGTGVMSLRCGDGQIALRCGAASFACIAGRIDPTNAAFNSSRKPLMPGAGPGHHPVDFNSITPDGLSSTFAAQGTGNLSQGAPFSFSTAVYQSLSRSHDLRHSSTSTRVETARVSVDNGLTFSTVATFACATGDAWFNGRSMDLRAMAGAANNANLIVHVVASFAPNTNDWWTRPLPAPTSPGDSTW